MLNIHKLVIEKFSEGLESTYHRHFGFLKPEFGGFIRWAAFLALENISNSDMLYHNVEHTMLVTAAGQDILIGKHLIEGTVTPEDWLRFLLGLLFHDIGYVRGVCRDDAFPHFATGSDNLTTTLPPGSTDAALTPYHVSRSQLFVRERFSENHLLSPYVDEICACIEMTRFPPPAGPGYQETGTYAGLTRAADFIGQLGDRDYLRKIPALFYEFEQIGTNAALGYKHPEDMRKGYATFFWKVVHQYLKDGVRYLSITESGRQWLSHLNSHIFEVEHDTN